MTNEETKCESLMIGGMSGHWLCEEKGCLQVGKEYCELCKEYKHLEKENAELSNSVTELTNSKTELENKVTELEKQIEKMKNCSNCKHKNDKNTDYYCEDCKRFAYETDTDKWEPGE
ncbi:MAG: hypothetical protein MJ181_11600 [Treponema sp.]|nr:hypothetical protein [Treponema sp.]